MDVAAHLLNIHLEPAFEWLKVCHRRALPWKLIIPIVAMCVLERRINNKEALSTPWSNNSRNGHIRERRLTHIHPWDRQRVSWTEGCHSIIGSPALLRVPLSRVLLRVGNPAGATTTTTIKPQSESYKPVRFSSNVTSNQDSQSDRLIQFPIM